MTKRSTSILMFAALFLIMPLNSTFAQKLISETLQSKTLVEEDDGFKWYRYTYEYQVKYKGNTVRFTRESAYNTNGRIIIDEGFTIDWIKMDVEYSKSIKKEYREFPSKIKDEYALFLEYNPSYGLFVAKKGNNAGEIVGSFSKEGVCYTIRSKFLGNGIIYGSYTSDKGGFRWLLDKTIAINGYAVVNNGNIVVPVHSKLKMVNGLYFGENDRTKDVYTSDGVLIGTVSYWTEKYVSYEFFDGPNGEKWLKYYNSSYDRDNKHNGFYYCLESGKKIDYGSNAVPEYHIEGRYLMLGNDLYKGDGERITNNEYTNVEKHLSSNNTSDFFLVSKGRDRKGVIKVEGNSYKEVIACEYGEISCLNADDGGDLFLVKRPYNGDIYRDGVIKVEGNKTREVLACNYDYHWSYETIGRYVFWKKLDEFYTVIVDNHGNTIVPLSKYYFHLSFSEEKNVFQGRKQSGNTVYEVALDLNGKELSCKKSYDITSKSSTTTTTQQPKQETVTPTPAPTPTPQPQPQPVRQPQPFQVWQPCGVCQGSGQCQSCLGTGHTLMYPCQDRCWNCGGSGKCTHCAGHGGQNIIVYQ